MVVIKLTTDEKKKINYIKSTTRVLKDCESKAIHLHPINSNMVSDIPVLIAELVVELYINHLIKLPEKTNNIKSIENKAIIKSYKLIHGQNLLFIKGLISKNIYYTSKQYNNLKYYNIDIPFECYTTITLNEFKSLTLNSLSFCDLIRSKINENCKYIYTNDKDYQMQPPDAKEFTELDTNMTISLEFQILQKQQVHISPSSNNNVSCYNTPLDLEDNNIKNESTKDDDISIENKSDLNILYNNSNYNNSSLDYNLENKPVSSDNHKFDNSSIAHDGINIKNEPSFSSLCNQNTYNDKLDLDYLLNFYNEPENNSTSNNKFSPNNNLNVKNKVDIKNILPSPLGSLYKENNYNDKLDLNYLLNFYSTSYNENELHSFNRFNSSNPKSYEQLILFLCLLILCNPNNLSTYL